MIAEVYDALVEAGASEEKARRAAEAIASYEDRFNRIDIAIVDLKSTIGELKGSTEREIGDLKNSTDIAFADLRSVTSRLGDKITVLMWAVGINAAATITMLVKHW
jgi:hypothetical protein